MIKSKKNKKSYKFPADPEFRKKAAYIADKVMRAINLEGAKIGAESDFNATSCPLGCLRVGKTRQMCYPFAHDVAKMSYGLINEGDAASFIRGFDDVPEIMFSKIGHVEEMFELGKSYRERFCG